MNNIARLFSLLLGYTCFVSVTVLGSLSCDGENLSYPGCGIIPSSSTISNGEPASYPWMAFLFHVLEANGDTSFCGATLISDIQLITAAHCVSGKTKDEVAVLIGNPNSTYEVNKWNFKYIYKIDIYQFYHENIDNGWKHNPDIAVITLEEPLLLSTKINPICLPSITDTSQTYEGVTATVAGWGITETGKTSMDQLLKVDLPILSNTECKSTYQWLKRCLETRNVTFKTMLLQFVSVSTSAPISLRQSQDTAREIQEDLSSFSTLKTGGKDKMTNLLSISFFLLQVYSDWSGQFWVYCGLWL